MQIIKINEERLYNIFTDNVSEDFVKKLYRLNKPVLSIESKLIRSTGERQTYYYEFLTSLVKLLDYRCSGTMPAIIENDVKEVADYLHFLYNKGYTDLDLSKLNKSTCYHIYNKSGISYALELFLKKLGYNVFTNRTSNLPALEKNIKLKPALARHRFEGAEYFDKPYADACRKHTVIKM